MHPSLQKIAEASSGLFFLSESDHPFEVVELGHPADPVTDLKALCGQQEGTVEQVDLDHFLRNQVRTYETSTPREKETAARFQHLKEVLIRELKEIIVYRIGQVQVDAFIIGKLEDGSLGGLRTRVVET